MADKAKSIADKIAAMFNGETEPKEQTQMPMATEMAKKADPEKRKQAADSLKKAFGG